ncbi:MAG: hypothetical protein ACP5O6_02625 [Candidatus Baltobacteraceae bacterium]
MKSPLSPRRRRLAPLVALAAAIAVVAPGIARAACTSERFTVEGSPLTIELCLNAVTLDPSTSSRIAHVEATTSTPTRSATASLALLLPMGSAASHAPASIELAPVGLVGTLHLTLHVTPSSASIDSALLTPGAVIIK